MTGFVLRIPRWNVIVSSMKRCVRCRKFKPMSHFPIGFNWKDGKFPYCLPCKRLAQRESYRRRVTVRASQTPMPPHRPSILVPQKRMTPTEWAYFAGIVDGEGTISITGTGYPYVAIVNTDGRLIDWLRERLGGPKTYEARPVARHKPVYRWKLMSERCIIPLRRSLRWLVIKKEHAFIVLSVAIWQAQRRRVGERTTPLPQSLLTGIRRLRRLNIRGLHPSP